MFYGGDGFWIVKDVCSSPVFLPHLLVKSKDQGYAEPATILPWPPCGLHFYELNQMKGSGTAFQFVGLPSSPASLPMLWNSSLVTFFLTHKAFCINPRRQLRGDRERWHDSRRETLWEAPALCCSHVSRDPSANSGRTEEATGRPLNICRTCPCLGNDGERKIGFRLPQSHYLPRTRASSF